MSDTTLAYKSTLDASGFASGAQQINSHLHQMGINTSAASANLGGIGTILGTLANPLTLVALGITAIGGALVGSAQAAAAWETSMSGVAKTSGLSGAALESMSKQLLTMSTNMPIAAKDLADLAGAAGSLGVGADFAEKGDYQGQANAMAEFAVVASKMGIGFGMAADEAATAGAKILNSFGKSMDSTNMEKLGSVVNTMGDNFAATEPQVLDFLNRASFLSSTMGQSIPQVAALGTTLISTGLEAEVAATGVKSMLNMLTSETSRTGGMDNWAKLMGTSVDELKAKVAGDLNGTLIETANKIAAIEDPVARFQAAVAAAGAEGAPALLKLAGQQENYQKALGMTNAEWEKASSLQKTYEAQAGTVNSQWVMFTNTLTMAATELGTGMLPYLADAIGFMTDLVKVGMKVAEVVGSWNLGEKISNVVSNIPGVSALSEGASSIWGDVKDWAGIGTEHAEQMAKEIEESDKLQKAGAEGLQAGIDAGVLKDPAKKAAKEFSKEFVEQFKSEQADREIANTLKSIKSGITAQDVDESLRTFDYLGEQFALRIRSHAGASVGDWFSYSLKAGDIVLAQSQASGNIDPLQAFTMATGLPAPAVGTEAYYRLLGDNIKAEKVKLQSQLKDTFDYSGIVSDLAARMKNEGDVLGKIGSDVAKTTFAAMLDNFRDPAAEKLSTVLAEVETLAKERPLATSEYQLYGEKYKSELFQSISDMGGYLKTFMGNLGKQATDAFSDDFFSAKERDDLLGMKPWLEALQKVAPNYFRAAGGEGYLAFLNAVESGASSGELEKILGDLGSKAGKSFAESLGMNMNNALDKFDWSQLEKTKMTLTGLSDGGKDFMKNAFQPEAIDNWKAQLDLWNTGLIENRETVELNMQKYERMIAVGNTWLFTPEQLLALQQHTNGIIDLGTALERVTKDTDNMKKETKKFTEQTDEACDACVSLLSLFDAWQESTPELFFPSYLGPSYGKEHEDFLAAKAAANRLAYMATEDSKLASQGKVNNNPEWIAERDDLTKLKQAYDQGTMSINEHAIANKWLGAEYNILQEQADGLASAIEGVNIAFDKVPNTPDRWIQFKQENQQDITPTLGLNTDPALNDFLAFKMAIEGESIETKLKIDDPTKTNKQTKQVDQGSDATRLLSIQMAITTSGREMQSTINRTGLNVSAFVQQSSLTISSSISSNSTGIVNAVNTAAMSIVAAINSLSLGGGGGASGVAVASGGAALSYASMSMPVYTGGPFAEGGYVDRPTIGLFGEAGPEYIVPESDMQKIVSTSAMSNMSITASIDSSGLQSQLQAAIGSMTVSPVIIPVAFDSEGMRETLTSILYEILQEVRV